MPSRLPVLWIAPCTDLYPPGLLELDPARLVLVRSGDDFSTVAAMETGLREGGLAAVVGEVGRLDRLIARRLQLACQRHDVTGFCLRRWPHGQRGKNLEASAAATRWLLSPAPSIRCGKEPGAARWHVALTHVRGGESGNWLMEVEAATNSLRVVAALADCPTATSTDPQKTSGHG